MCLPDPRCVARPSTEGRRDSNFMLAPGKEGKKGFPKGKKPLVSFPLGWRRGGPNPADQTHLRSAHMLPGARARLQGVFWASLAALRDNSESADRDRISGIAPSRQGAKMSARIRPAMVYTNERPPRSRG